MEQPKKQLSEDELRRLIALDRARVEESLAKNKATGRKIGGIIALAIVLVLAITVFTIISINQHR